MAKHRAGFWSLTPAHDKFPNSNASSKDDPAEYVGDMLDVIGKLGSGSFGNVYLAVDTKSEKLEPYAVEAEDLTMEYPQLRIEHAVLRRLKHKYFPKVYSFETVKSIQLMKIRHGPTRLLVMELMGPNLAQLLGDCGGKFSLKTVYMLFDQLLEIMQCLHSHGLAHRDIKPQNLVMGSYGPEISQLKIIDFGFVSAVPPMYEKQGGLPVQRIFVGTPWYASLVMHRYHPVYPADDLESCCYVMFYLLRGSLPWQSICRNETQETKSEWYDRIAESKRKLGGSKYRKKLYELYGIFELIMSADRERKPCYWAMMTVLRDGLEERRLKYDFKYEWRQPFAFSIFTRCFSRITRHLL